MCGNHFEGTQDVCERREFLMMTSQHHKEVPFLYLLVLLALLGILMPGDGDAGCDMSAECLIVLAREGVAKSTSLSELDLSGSQSVCEKICAWSMCVSLPETFCCMST